jgi:hypothetical protein
MLVRGNWLFSNRSGITEPERTKLTEKFPTMGGVMEPEDCGDRAPCAD